MKSCPQCKLKYPDDAAGCFLCGGALVMIQDPLIGVTIAGRYQIEEVLGQGGMATVYAARHRLVDRPCAVKVMSPQYTAQRRDSRALSARGQGRAEARAPEHHRDLRSGGNAGRLRVLGDGAATRRDPGRRLGTRQSAARARPADHDPDRSRARPRARPGGDSPRLEAGKHLPGPAAQRRRSGEAAGFWDRALDARLASDRRG